MKFIKRFEELTIGDVPLVGGKNASLGEMIQNLASKGVSVPSGFAITAQAYTYHLEKNNLTEKIKTILAALNKNNLDQLATIGNKVRTLIETAPLPEEIASEVRTAYKDLEKRYGTLCDVAVRSSATAEDLPDASFAGQQATFLNIQGDVSLLENSRCSTVHAPTIASCSFAAPLGAAWWGNCPHPSVVGKRGKGPAFPRLARGLAGPRCRTDAEGETF